jgi:hypothetical protein
MRADVSNYLFGANERKELKHYFAEVIFIKEFDFVAIERRIL